MDFVLNANEVRVLGALMEKKMGTPEYYPLSLNALTNACNQKTNRHPVVSYDENIVQTILDELKQKGLVSKSLLSRVTKYEENFIGKTKVLNKEAAVVAILMLRGAQTAGEIKARTERLYNFETLENFNETISNLEEWGYILKLPRQPGQKEQRYLHLLSGKPEINQTELTNNNEEIYLENEKIGRLEEEIKLLKLELSELKQAFLDFKNQF